MHDTAPTHADSADNRCYETGLVPAEGWAGMSAEARHRTAAAAAQAHDVPALLDLADTYLTLYGRAGARVSDHTRAAYREGMRQLLAAWRQENLLQPSHDAGAVWVRRLEADGASPSTVRVRLAGARMLYRALRWAKATRADPFSDAKAAPETTAPWDKRQPYSEADIARLLHHADPLERAIVLLGAHAGLRVSEMCALTWRSVDGDHLTVERGKGGKRRRVTMSRSLQEALQNMPENIPGRDTIPLGNGYVLGGLNPDAVRYRLECLCERAGVRYRAAHSLRHAAGTRLYRATEDLNVVAAHLGHASIETTRIYSHMAEDRVKRAVGEW